MDRTFELKLLIEKKSPKVLFAEVGKDVVDFLFNLLRLPIGSVAQLLTEESTYGPLSNTYRSWERLDRSFLSSTRMTANRFIPVISGQSFPNLSLLLSTSPATVKEKAYVCKCNTFSDVEYGTYCNSCLLYMNRELSYVGPSITKEAVVRDGYVKGSFTYAVMDDLSMVPMTPVGSIAFLNKMGIKDLSLLEEKTVSLDGEQGLKLLKTSLKSKNVLTDVFLTNKK